MSSEADNAALAKTASAARDARLFADLAREEEQLGDITSGWKASAYRGTRKMTFATVFKALALAADQASKRDLASFPQAVQDSAALAAELATQYAGRKPLPDGRPDWTGIASDLSGFGSQPPADLALLGALASVLSGQNRFALYEIELVDPKSLNTGDQRTQYHVLRSVILSQNELRHLAVLELDNIDIPGDGETSEPQLLAGIHLWLAWLYLENGDYRKADLELVRAMRLWPNNPVSVFLTGERLAATGEYEKAAESLARASRDTSQEWLANRIAQRAANCVTAKATPNRC